MRCYIGVASQDHVRRGLAGSFAQVCHGKKGPLAKWRKGDVVVYYSAKKRMEGTELLQKFTAIGLVRDDDAPVQVEMLPGFCPFRRSVDFISTAVDADIRPLIRALSFIKNKDKWGGAFRFGVLEIPEADMRIIAKAMHVSIG